MDACVGGNCTQGLYKGESQLKTVGICGHFAFGRVFLDGQTVKTKIVYEELAKVFGQDQVQPLDTYGGKKALIRLLVRLVCLLGQCRNVVIMPAHNGIRVMAPLLAFFNLFFRRKLHYVVIGGWLNDLLEGKKLLTGCLKRFDCIYTETHAMKKALEDRGFHNVTVMPNCKRLPRLEESDLVYSHAEPYRLCTFSRVMKEKGIADAVEAVKTVNRQCGRTVYTLDIYGQIDPLQEIWFADLRKDFPEEIRYCGEVPFDQSVFVLKEYFALLFPTRFYTEGIPGTIIDAYAAGVPVIASMWQNYSDILDEETGLGYVFGDKTGLETILRSLVGNPERLKKKKPACLSRARNFAPEKVIRTLISEIEGGI